MLKSNKYLSVIFCVSSGLNDENLGSDEQEIIQIFNLIIDVGKYQTVDICQFLIKPRNGKSTNFITDECKVLTGISESTYDNNSSLYLEEAIEEMDKRLLQKNIHPSQYDNDFCFVTDGPLHLRQAIIPECTKKDIKLPYYYYAYYDIRKEFYNLKSKSNDKISSLEDICNCLGTESINENSYGLKQCRLIEKIIYKMLENGYQFTNMEIISKELQQGLCSIDESIEENTIVRVRGLPWQCTDQDVSKFFAGLNISEGGVALCLSSQGRRNGEALVRFINEEHRNYALRRHKHHIGQRYIEVYRASGKDFLNIAGGSNAEAKTFLSRNGKVIIRMRGLPFDAVAKDVIEFFERGENSCEIIDGENGVLFVHYPDGRATGDAFIMLKSEDEARKVLLKHKEMMGARYIELFRSTSAEVQQVFKRSQDPKFYQNNFKDMPIAPLPMLPPEMMTSGNRKDCIRLRNLPLECGVEQILEFLGIHSQHIIHQGVHMILNAQGQPSGEAFIQFDGEQSSLNVSNHKNGKCMYFSGRKYYIEVLQCSAEEMNLVLLGILPSNLINFNQSGNRPSTPKSLHNSSSLSNSNLNYSNLSNGPNNTTSNPYLIPNYPPNVQSSTSHPPPAPTSTASIPLPQTPNIFYPNPMQTAPQLNALSSTSSMGGPVTLPTNPIIPNSLIANQILPPNQFANNPYAAPIIYWYPTPPVSPSSALYLHTTPNIYPVSSQCILIVKGAPINITAADILQFFNGYEILPDCIQIQNNNDAYQNGISTADVIITLFNRSEAERAVFEKNHQKIGNHIVELYLSY